jgi:hypothetical protein
MPPEEHLFDELARGVADGATSRSRVLKSLFTALLGRLLSIFALSRDAAAKPKTFWAFVNADGAILDVSDVIERESLLVRRWPNERQ